MSFSKHIKNFISGLKSSVEQKKIQKSVDEFKRAREALKQTGKTQSLGYLKSQIKEGSDFTKGLEEVSV